MDCLSAISVTSAVNSPVVVVHCDAPTTARSVIYDLRKSHSSWARTGLLRSRSFTVHFAFEVGSMR